MKLAMGLGIVAVGQYVALFVAPDMLKKLNLDVKVATALAGAISAVSLGLGVVVAMKNSSKLGVK